MQINAICDLVDSELQRLRLLSNESVTYLVLSGGLGSSAYVQEELATRFMHTEGGHTNAKRIKIKAAENPRLAVVHGLVIDYVQRRRSIERGMPRH